MGIRGAAIMVAVLLACFYFLMLSAYGNLIVGRAVTLSCIAALAGLLASLFVARKDIAAAVSGSIDRRSIAVLCIIILLFVVFAVFFLSRTELIFFDENIYQSTALNILHNGNALMCLYGTQYLKQCFSTTLGFDPGGWPFLIAIGFLFSLSYKTSYGVELVMAVLSIASIFVMSSVLTKRKSIGILSAAILALTPELFIWSKTLANPNLPFMAFATLTTALFVIFLRKSSKRTFAPLMFGMAFTMYLRVEAAIMVPIFAITFLVWNYDSVRRSVVPKCTAFLRKSLSDAILVALLLIFVFIVIPEVLSIVASRPVLQANAVYYLGQSSTLFSFSNFIANVPPDLSFLAGFIRFYPVIFLPNLTIFAIMGAAYLFYRKKIQKGRSILLVPALIFIGYLAFYLFYFSGSVLVGTSVRYMLILYPTLALLSAYGIVALSDFVLKLIYGKAGLRPNVKTIATYSIILAVAFLLPFASTITFLQHPSYSYYDFPVNATTSGMPQYTIAYTNRSLAFVRDNYRLVQPDCLVMSEDPFVWYMLNRSSSQLVDNTDIFTNSSLSGYGCYVLDYDSWCTMSPYNSTVCAFYTSHYKLKTLATEPGGAGYNFSLYQIINYSNT